MHKTPKIIFRGITAFVASAALLGMAACGSQQKPASQPKGTPSLSASSSPSAGASRQASSDAKKLADYIASPDITKQVETANTQMGKDGRVSLASEGKTVVMTVTLNNSLFGSQPLDTVKQNLRSKKDLFADQYATIGGQIVKQIQQQTKLEDLHLKLNICTEDGEAIITKTYDEKSSSSALKNSQSGSSSPSSSSSH